VGLGAVLNHRNALGLSELQYGLDVGRLAADMRYHDGFGQGGEYSCYFRSPGIVLPGSSVGDDRNAGIHHDGHNAARVGDGSHDDFGEGRQVEGPQRDVYRVGAGVHAVSVSAAQESGELLPELFFLLAVIAEG